MFIGDLRQRHQGSTVASGLVPALIGNSLDNLLRLNCRWFTSVDVLWLMISTKLSERG